MRFQMNCGHGAQQQLDHRRWKRETNDLTWTQKTPSVKAWIELLNSASYKCTGLHFFFWRLLIASKQHLYFLVIGAIYTPRLHRFISTSLFRISSTSFSMSTFSPTTSLLESHSSIPFSLNFNHVPRFLCMREHTTWALCFWSSRSRTWSNSSCLDSMSNSICQIMHKTSYPL